MLKIAFHCIKKCHFIAQAKKRYTHYYLNFSWLLNYICVYKKCEKNYFAKYEVCIYWDSWSAEPLRLIMLCLSCMAY